VTSRAPGGPDGAPYDEAFWRDILTRGSPLERVGRRVLKRIPSDSRCQLCAAPFQGPGAPVIPDPTEVVVLCVAPAPPVGT